MAAAKKAPKKRVRTTAHRKERKGKPEGNPPFKTTAQQRMQVEKMVGMGLTYKQVASLTINPTTKRGISTSTLQKNFRDELETGQAKAIALVAESLYSKATSKDHPQAASCAMFFLKCRGGWRQEDKMVHAIEPGSVGVLVAPARVTPEEWIREQTVKNSKREPPSRNGDG